MSKDLDDLIALVGDPNDLPDAFFHALAGLLLSNSSEGSVEEDHRRRSRNDASSQFRGLPADVEDGVKVVS